MATVGLTIRDSDKALVICADHRPSITNGFVAAFASSMFWIFALHSLLRSSILAGTAILAAGLSFALATRRTISKLQISKDEIISKGRVGDSFRSKRQMRAEDVQWLEYQEDTTGPETSHHPGGLYAVLSHSSVCILPEIDDQQATEVIERIASRFPELSRKWQSHSPFGRNLLSLELKDWPPRS